MAEGGRLMSSTLSLCTKMMHIFAQESNVERDTKKPKPFYIQSTLTNRSKRMSNSGKICIHKEHYDYLCNEAGIAESIRQYVRGHSQVEWSGYTPDNAVGEVFSDIENILQWSTNDSENL